MISTFDWTNDAVQRIFRVPAGLMRSQTQERIDALARERAAACRAEAFGEGGVIDLALVEDGIEIGKQMMTESQRFPPTLRNNPGQNPCTLSGIRSLFP